MPEPSVIQATYESFDAFLKHLIKDFYIRRGKTHPIEYAALLLASGQTISIGVDTLKEGSVGKKLATGAVGAVALRLGLKYALSGPLGIIATGLSAAAGGGYLVRNQEKISKLRRRYKTQIAEARESYDKALNQYQVGRFTASERNLMMDGLSHRLMQGFMTPMPEDSAVTPENDDPQS
jgi:hypothetical protein